MGRCVLVVLVGSGRPVVNVPYQSMNANIDIELAPKLMDLQNTRPSHCINLIRNITCAVSYDTGFLSSACSVHHFMHEIVLYGIFCTTSYVDHRMYSIFCTTALQYKILLIVYHLSVQYFLCIQHFGCTELFYTAFSI